MFASSGSEVGEITKLCSPVVIINLSIPSHFMIFATSQNAYFGSKVARFYHHEVQNGGKVIGNICMCAT